MHLVTNKCKSLCTEEENWHGGRLKAIFETKAAFDKARRSTTTVCNSRSVFVKTHGSNDVDVQEDWQKVKDASDEGILLDAAPRLSDAGSSLVTF